MKKTKVNELNFSTAVNLFILSHNNKYILPFLEICNNYNYIKDDINKDFSNLLNDYIKFSDGFLSVFVVHKKKDNYDYYVGLLDTFLLTYYSLYDKDILYDDFQIALRAHTRSLK